MREQENEDSARRSFPARRNQAEQSATPEAVVAAISSGNRHTASTALSTSPH